MAGSSALSTEGLKAVLEADLLPTAASAAVFGLLCHAVVSRIELDLYMYHYLASSMTTVLGLFYGYLFLTDLTMLQAIVRIALIVASFDTALFVSIGVYRLFFHRLRKFPGPLGAKVSRFYTVSKAAKHVQYYKEVAKMHEKYGDFVRTGPREICIVRKSAIPIIYGPNSNCLKSTWYMQVSSNHEKCSIHMTRDFDDHKRRRKAWDRGFSIRALGTYEPRIKSKADLFTRQLRSRVNQPIDATAWSMFFSFDVMGDVGLGRDFNCLASGTEHSAIKGVHDHMAVLGVMSNVPWLLNILGSIPGATAGYAPFFRWCANEIIAKQKTWDSEAYPQDIVSWLLKAFIEKDSSASPSSDALQEDSRVVIIAGSETTATTLAQVLYYLAKHPATLKKLQRHLDAVFPSGPNSWSYDGVKSISFVDDVINETLRLKPALLTGGYRVTPSQGLQIDEVYIPGNTNVFVPVQLIQTDERYWKQPLDFIPERFGERREEMGTEGAPYIPFALGAYSCPGKNLALMSLRISVSCIAQQFDISFAPGEDGERFDKDAMDTFTTTLPPLMLTFTPRS